MAEPKRHAAMGEKTGDGDCAPIWTWLSETEGWLNHYRRHLLLLEAQKRARRDARKSEPDPDDPPTLADFN